MNIFKSKAQKEKDKKKKELNKKISAIGTGGGRSAQGTKKRLQRELKSLDIVKVKKKRPSLSGAQKNKRKNYGNNQTGGGGGSTSKKTTTKTTMTGAERAKALAKRNIKKYGGTASAAAANKEAMRLKIKKITTAP